MKSALSVILFLGLSVEAKKEYQPSQRVLEKMGEIELERYQHKFNYPMKHHKPEEDLHNHVSLAQGASLVEATLDQVATPTKKSEEGVKRVNKVYGARSSYIANALLSDDEYLNCFVIWAAVFTVIIYGLNKLMKASLQTKSANKAVERLEAFSLPAESTGYKEMPAPKSLSDVV